MWLMLAADKQRRVLKDENLSCLEELTPDDVRTLIEYEEERSRAGRFVRVFPTADTRHYLKYVSTQSLYYNRLLADWEETYAFKRDEGNGVYHRMSHANCSCVVRCVLIAGIKLLQNLCEQKYHLKRDETLVDVSDYFSALCL